MAKRITRLAVVFGILLIACVPAAFSQNQPQVFTTDTYVESQVSTNQCSFAGEPVALTGTMHAEMTFTTDAEGVNHFSIVISNDLNGIGQKSGMPYTAQDSNTYTISTGDSAGDITVEFRSDLTPVGAGATMTLIQTLHLSANSSGTVGLEVKDNNTQCGS